ncbi:MAG: rod shape-determining protein MreD [Lachnospiraceae bacterium]|nr:rod shape-determining protein MreD [Lachnospiraceae bacterium]MCR5766966.1 rod shape-determining protein MreD [Lachnospiraceae bacterium]
MIIRGIAVIIQVIALYLLQTSVFTSFALAGVVPDLLMIPVVAVAFTRGPNKGMMTGFISGLLIDFTYSSFLGLFALMYLVIGFLTGYANKIYDENDYTLPVILISISEFLYNLMYYIFFYFLNGKLNFGFYLYRFMIPKVIYTVLISLLLYRLFNLENIFFKRFDRQ